jgi:hypothetical protein
MNPAVGKILWHLSIYGSDLKSLLLLLLLGVAIKGATSVSSQKENCR